MIAEGEQASSEAVAVRLKPAEPEAGRKPNLWVLAAGVQTYAKQPNLKLNYAATDAKAFVDALKRQAHGALYGEVQAQLLRDGEVTWDSLDAGLQWLAQKVDTGDVAMVFFSGHGANDHYGNLMLLPSEAEVTSEARLQRTGFPYSALQQALVPLASRAKVVVFLDACYSGNLKGPPPDPSRAVSDLAAEENGVIVFASSGPKQLSEEYAPGGHGAFTQALLDGVAGPADYDKDKVLRFSELRRFVREEVGKLTEERQQPVAQVPEKRWGDPPLLTVR